MDDPLIVWRAIHFASTIMVAGVVFFLVYIFYPAFAFGGKDMRLAVPLRRRLGRLAWISLLLVLISGVGWLIGVAQQISDGTLSAVLWDGIVWTVLTKTNFGSVWLVRSAFVVLVSAFLPKDTARWLEPRPSGAVISVALLAGSLGFAGHAAGSTGITGYVHLASDIVHLIAAAMWVGALVPLAMLLRAVGGAPDGISVAREAVQRFSMLGIASVSALLVTGLVNTWVLAGSVTALLDTTYGWLLIAKIALFLVMVATAGINRRILTPRLVQEIDAIGAHEAARRLYRNSLIEAAIGAVVLLIVAVLGTLPPGLHDEVAAAAFGAL